MLTWKMSDWNKSVLFGVKFSVYNYNTDSSFASGKYLFFSDYKIWMKGFILLSDKNEKILSD